MTHTQEQHSPLPWKASEVVSGAVVSSSAPRDNLLGLDAEGCAIFMRQGDAALAVRAVNLHAELVSRLQEARDMLRDVCTVIRKLDSDREYFRIISIIDAIRERQRELIEFAKAESR